MSEDTARFDQYHLCKRQRPVNLQECDEGLFAAEYTRQIGPSRIDRAQTVRILGGEILTKSGPPPALIPADIYELVRNFINTPRLGLRAQLQSSVRHLAAALLPRASRDSGIWVVNEWTHGYFHWLTEALTRIEMARLSSVEGEVLLPAEYRKFSFIGQSLDYLRIPYQYLPARRLAAVRELVLPSSEIVTGNFNCFLLGSLAARFRLAAQSELTSSQVGGRRVWVSRARANKRKIANEEELRPILAANGFEVVNLEGRTFSEQVKLFRHTSIIAGLHGAGLTNMLFMPTGANVVEIRRRGDTHSNCYYSMASSLKLNYYYLLADPLSADHHADDCLLPTAALHNLLEQIRSV
jgi:capsular polysaccharide biosynthesis protein